MADIVAGSRAGRVWIGTVGRPVMARALPTWLGLAIVAGVTMGGNGMSPRDVVDLASAPRPLLVLGGAWLLLSVASVRAAFAAPGTGYLRSLPGGAGWEVASVVAMSVVAHLPWGVLWLLGAGPARGAAVWAAMAVVSLLIVGGVLRLSAARPRSVPRWRGPLRALIGVLGRGLVRRRASAMIAGAGVAAIGGAFAALVIGHEARSASDAAIISGTCAALAIAGALIAATSTVAEADRQVSWLAETAAVPDSTRRAARAIVLGACGVLAGLVATAAARAVTCMPGDQLAGTALAHVLVGLGLGLGAVEVADRARRAVSHKRGGVRHAGDGDEQHALGFSDGGAGGRIDGGRVVAGMMLLGMLALLSLAALRDLGLVAFLAVGAGLAAGAGVRA